MEKKLKRRWYLFLGLLAGFIIIGVNIYAELNNQSLTVESLITLIGSVLVFCGVILGVVLSGNTNKQIDSIKVDVKKLDDRMIAIDDSFDNLETLVKGVDKRQIALDVGFIDISDKILHKDKIINLAKKIEINTCEIFDNHFDINTFLKDFIIQLNDGISLIIRNQYEYGFNEFNTNYFKRKLLANLNVLSEFTDFSLINKYIFDNILTSIEKNICKYIKEINLIKNLENGQRRNKFEKLTLDLTKRITNYTIEIYNKQKISA